MTGTPAPLSVLVLCTGNSARSQMAEALLRRAGRGAIVVASAGTVPAGVHPLTVQVLAEVGIDWTSARSKAITEFLDQPFDVVVTVCDRAREACPFFPGAREQLHHGFDDPAAIPGSDAERLDAFRRVRDEIEGWARTFAAQRVGAQVGA